ncbi:MAG: glutamate racemase [Firmicutes bacterium]|nr:glutamate racemase [Bacillota bacterium]
MGEARQHPIGVYDSGVGGLTVVHWLREILPKERILYFGDTARVPYGGRTPGEIIEFSRQIVAFFQKQGVKFIIAACNTSSALALPVVAPISPIPIMGVIGAGAHRALEVTSNKKVGVIGTEATVESHAYAYALEELDPSVTVYERACPRLVPLIEAGHWEGEVVREPLRQYLTPLAKQDIDTLILGCTHYPFLLGSVQELLGPKVEIVDPAEATAKEAREKLGELDLWSLEKLGEDGYFVSGDPISFRASSARLGYTHRVEHVDITKYTI